MSCWEQNAVVIVSGVSFFHLLAIWVRKLHVKRSRRWEWVFFYIKYIITYAAENIIDDHIKFYWRTIKFKFLTIAAGLQRNSLEHKKQFPVIFQIDCKVEAYKLFKTLTTFIVS